MPLYSSQRNRWTPAPLGKIHLIDTPIKRISIYLIGPIKPKSGEGHQYILTVMGYATGDPEART